MAEVVAISPIEVAPADGSALLVLFAFAFLGLSLYFVYRAMSDNKKEELEQNNYLKTYMSMRTMALQNADDRYFKSWWRPSKNATIHRLFEWKETKKIRLEPMVGGVCKYMGHYQDDGGFYNIAFTSKKEMFVIPVIEVVSVPSKAVHMQDDSLIINCVSIDRKSPNAPYFPVVNMVDGTVCEAGFTFFKEFYDSKVSASVIEQQGDLFISALDKVTKFNANVAFKRKTKGGDGGTQ